MEEIDEVERLVWGYGAATKEKDWDGVGEGGGNEGVWRKGLGEEGFGVGYEADCAGTKRIKIKYVGIDTWEQEKPGSVSPIKQVEHRHLTWENSLKKQKNAWLVSLITKTHPVKEKIRITHLDAEEKVAHSINPLVGKKNTRTTQTINLVCEHWVVGGDDPRTVEIKVGWCKEREEIIRGEKEARK